MSSVRYLREFVNERLIAAAEEIFGVFEKTIIEYEEEIDRQRRLLDVVWKPEIKLHSIELPQQHVWKEEDVLADQPLCIQERSSSPDQEEPGPAQIKEEQEELCTSQEGEQFELKQETDAFMLIPPYEESDDSEDETLNIFVKSSVAPEPNRDHQLLSHTSDEAESQNQTGDKHGDSGSTRNVKSRQQNQRHKSKSRTDNLSNPAMSVIHGNTHKGKKTFICDTCGKAFKGKTDLERHMRIHTGEKPYTCKTCGKDYGRNSYLIVHMRTHTGERPYSCSTCGKGFAQKSVLKNHMRMHTGERPFFCKTCGKDFTSKSGLIVHMRIHTGEKPFTCKICGRAFRIRGHLIDHMRIHTGEKPYSCKTCGKRFSRPSHLKSHVRLHAGESSRIPATPVENISEVIVTCSPHEHL